MSSHSPFLQYSQYSAEVYYISPLKSLLSFITSPIVKELHWTISSFSDFTFFYTNDAGYPILLCIKKITSFSNNNKLAIHALVLKQNIANYLDAS